ncbi:MAG: hypothetical protein R3F59_35480 [Myxococcota bacterium]
MVSVLVQIADDEARHAELSWALVRWLLGRDPSLEAVARAAFDGFALGTLRIPEGEPEAEVLAAHGAPGAAERHALAQEVLTEVIRPCAELLLGRVPAC